MKTVRRRLLLIPVLFGIPAGLAAPERVDDSKIKIVTAKGAGKVDFLMAGDKPLLRIEGGGGIGKVRLERGADPWPAGFTVRLHLQGLESFTISHGVTTLRVSVGSHGGDSQTVRLIENGREEVALREGDPGWVAVSTHDREGKEIQKLPEKGGYFDLRLPASLFKDNPAGLDLAWIDFYRG